MSYKMIQQSILTKAVSAAVALGGVSGAFAGLEEIIVTAQKREQSLQDAPLAISAFDAGAIESQRIRDVTDVGQFAPNVQIVQSPAGISGATVGIRGSVTINPAITWEPSVGMYLDGVFLGKNIGGVFDVAELERVEVLRGPQGSLYGKNTVGGAINLITRKPSGEFGGKLRAGVGNFDLREAYISVDTPAMAGLAANFTALKTTRDGFYDNVPDPFDYTNPFPDANPPQTSEFNDADNQSWRVALAWQLSENFRADYTYDNNERDNQPAMGALTAAYTLTPDLFPPQGFYPEFIGLNNYLQADENDRPDEITADKSLYEKSETDGHGLTLALDVAEMGVFGDVTFKSISAIRNMTYDDAIDIDGSPLDLLHTERHIDYDQRSQELQMIGKTDSVDYVLGVYYFDEEGDVFNPISFFAGFGSDTSFNRYGLDNQSMAVYGQADWRPQALQQRLTISLGARWTKEERESYIEHPPTSFDPGFAYTVADDEWTNTSPSLTLAWQAADDTNLYFRVAQGWKSGGFNGESATLAGFQKAYDPEEVTSYELGMKSRFADNRVQLNLAVFRNDITDMQLSVFEGGGAASSTISNAGEATMSGFEVELVAQLTDNLQLLANYGYLDAEYDEYIDGGVDVKNQRDFAYAPENTASIGFDWRVAALDWGNLDLRADWSYNDEHVVYIDPVQNASSQIDSYSLVNARLALSDVALGDSTSLTIALWGKNLADEEYRRNTIPVGPWTVSYYGDPRTYGLDVTLNF